jgi:hypothetical protein
MPALGTTEVLRWHNVKPHSINFIERVTITQDSDEWPRHNEGWRAPRETPLAWIVRGEKSSRVADCPHFMVWGKECVDDFIATRATKEERELIRKHYPQLCCQSIKPLRDKAQALARHKTTQDISDNAQPSEGVDLAEELASLIIDADIRAYVLTWAWYHVLEVFGDHNVPVVRNTALCGHKIVRAIDDAALRYLAIDTHTCLERDRKVTIARDGTREYDWHFPDHARAPRAPLRRLPHMTGGFDASMTDDAKPFTVPVEDRLMSASADDLAARLLQPAAAHRVRTLTAKAPVLEEDVGLEPGDDGLATCLRPADDDPWHAYATASVQQGEGDEGDQGDATAQQQQALRAEAEDFLLTHFPGNRTGARGEPAGAAAAAAPPPSKDLGADMCDDHGLDTLSQQGSFQMGAAAEAAELSDGADDLMDPEPAAAAADATQEQQGTSAKLLLW